MKQYTFGGLTVSDLYFDLYNMIEDRNQHLQSINVSEGVTGDIEYRKNSGEVIGKIHEGVIPGQTEMTFGEESATISDNVMGGSKIDFGGTDVINSYENIYDGGETFRSLTDVVGYTKPNSITGGIDFFNGHYKKVANISNPDMFGNLNLSYSSPSPDISGFDFASQDWSLLDNTYNFDIDFDDGETTIDILSMISDWI